MSAIPTHTGGIRRPETKLIRNRIKKTTNNTHAICVAAPASPDSPRTPAINPTTKNVKDQLSITFYLLPMVLAGVDARLRIEVKRRAK
jgi:hypothetical protein